MNIDMTTKFQAAINRLHEVIEDEDTSLEERHIIGLAADTLEGIVDQYGQYEYTVELQGIKEPEEYYDSETDDYLTVEGSVRTWHCISSGLRRFEDLGAAMDYCTDVMSNHLALLHVATHGYDRACLCIYKEKNFGMYEAVHSYESHYGLKYDEYHGEECNHKVERTHMR